MDQQWLSMQVGARGRGGSSTAENEGSPAITERGEPAEGGQKRRRGDSRTPSARGTGSIRGVARVYFEGPPFPVPGLGLGAAHTTPRPVPPYYGNVRIAGGGWLAGHRHRQKGRCECKL